MRRFSPSAPLFGRMPFPFGPAKPVDLTGAIARAAADRRDKAAARRAENPDDWTFNDTMAVAVTVVLAVGALLVIILFAAFAIHAGWAAFSGLVNLFAGPRGCIPVDFN